MIVQGAVQLGITKVRVTGGEPLARAGIVEFIGMLSRVKGLQDIAMTTNGVLLQRYASELRQAGLLRVNVSLDTLKEDRFKRITRGGRLANVLDGIRAAEEAGLSPIKINVVALRGLNDDEIIDFANLTFQHPWHVRFIELMPLGGKGTKLEEEPPRCLSTDFQALIKEGQVAQGFLSIGEIKQVLRSLGNLRPYGKTVGNGPARYFKLPRSKGSLGFISPISEYFCANCNRLRLTADGHLRPCLLHDNEIDLRTPLRMGASPHEVQELIKEAITAKPERHSLGEANVPKDRVMAQIGG